ncbi:MAG: UPF0280 family protein [Dehalococcoidia bacterium]|nr:UPF0280 family protein [Dehalococcoidia bacterium]
MTYQPRAYRHAIKDTDLVSFEVTVKETDLYVRARRDLYREALAAVGEYRLQLEGYIQAHPIFLHSLEPVQVEESAPQIVKMMAEAGQAAGVGPMAAVAGAVAELVGKKLLEHSAEVVVENGGDIFIKTGRKRLVGIYAGNSPFNGKLAVEISPSKKPVGICTSSGTVGPSLSLGLADAVVVVSPSTHLADAAATAAANLVKSPDDIPSALERGQRIKGVEGIMVIAGDRMGVWGKIKLSRL